VENGSALGSPHRLESSKDIDAFYATAHRIPGDILSSPEPRSFPQLHSLAGRGSMTVFGFTFRHLTALQKPRADLIPIPACVKDPLLRRDSSSVD
jgi:hypothetical protein